MIWLSFCRYRTYYPIISQDLEGVQPEDLKEKAKVGYRADRILRLARDFRDGTVDPDWLESPERTRYRKK